MTKRVLISVSDKAGIVEFAQELKKLGWEIISTGGTKVALDNAGVDTIAIDDVTGFPEMMDGRVKTLHPNIHGGLLARRDLDSHLEAAKDNKIELIDLVVVNLYPQLFTPNLKTIQNPCLSLDPGWFLFSPNGCFLLDKKEFPLYGISVEKNTKRKETHMNSLPNHHFQNKSFYQLSFDGGHLTQYGGLIFFQELFSQLKLKERISKYLVTNDQRRYCRYSDSDILVQFLFQLLTGYGTDYACKELSADAYFPK
ncbi:TPA: transposase, partial [Streptococcus pneumoniae]